MFASVCELERAVAAAAGPEKYKSGFLRVERFFARYLEFFRRRKVVTVGGTNGKGGTCLALESLLLRRGYRTALWTSPHVVDFSERFRFDGRQGRLDELGRAFVRLGGVGLLSYYEFAFALFCECVVARDDVEIIILEVGLGGRLDCVNVFDADVAAITSISRDHTAVLGLKMGDILREKFGISRPRRPLVTSLESAFLRSLCSRWSRGKGVSHLDVFEAGYLVREDSFVVRNGLLARVLEGVVLSGRLPDRAALASVRKNPDQPDGLSPPGRLEEVTLRGRRFIFVGTHNLDGFRNLCRYGMRAYRDRAGEIDVLAAFSRRPLKEVLCCLKVLEACPHFYHRLYITSFCHTRSLGYGDAASLARKATASCGFVDSWKDFLDSHDKSKTIMVLGSYYFVSVVLKDFR